MRVDRRLRDLVPVTSRSTPLCTCSVYEILPHSLIIKPPSALDRPRRSSRPRLLQQPAHRRPLQHRCRRRVVRQAGGAALPEGPPAVAPRVVVPGAGDARGRGRGAAGPRSVNHVRRRRRRKRRQEEQWRWRS